MNPSDVKHVLQGHQFKSSKEWENHLQYVQAEHKWKTILSFLNTTTNQATVRQLMNNPQDQVKVLSEYEKKLSRCNNDRQSLQKYTNLSVLQNSMNQLENELSECQKLYNNIETTHQSIQTQLLKWKNK